MGARIRIGWPLAAAAAFTVLLLLAAGGWPPLAAADSAVGDAFRRYGTQRAGLVAFLRVATDVAATGPYLLAGAVLTGLLLARRARGAALFCAAATAVVPLIWAVLHWLLRHPRPVDGFVAVHTNGFPSGHTSNATAAALVAVLLLWHRLGRRGRAAAVLAAGAFAVFIGLTRVALVVHWPSQVLGGWLLALAVVPLLARATADRGDRHLTVRAAPTPAPGSRPAPGCAGKASPGSG